MRAVAAPSPEAPPVTTAEMLESSFTRQLPCGSRFLSPPVAAG
jgi:hypothetical protein